KVILDNVQVAHEVIPSNAKALTDMLNEFGQNSSGIVTNQGGLNYAFALETALSLFAGNSFSRDGVTFDASQLQAAYANHSRISIYTPTGPSSLTVPHLGTITVQLGSQTPSTQGLVITGDNFTSLNATVSGTLNIGGLQIHSDGLVLTYHSGQNGQPDQ